MINQVFTQLLNVIVSIYLARLLTPRDFGVVGMITVIIGFAAVISEFGVGSAIIQKRNINEKDLTTVFWLNIFIAISITILINISAKSISNFYELPELETVTRLLSLPFLFTSFGAIQRSLLIRELNFKVQFFINITATIISSFIAIYMAYSNYGYWSLIAKSILFSFLCMILYWLSKKWTPKFLFSKLSLKEVFNFSIPLLGTNALNYWARNLDNILIGKYIGGADLGYYSKAYELMLLPVRQISGVISRVLFPSFSAIQDDRERIKKIYLKVVLNVSALTFPIMTILSVLSTEFILIVLGEQWLEMNTVLKILCILGAVQSVGTLNGNIFMATGNTKLQFRVGLIVKLVLISAIIGGISSGIEGVALYYTIASVIVTFPLFGVIGKLINMSVKQVLNSIKPAFICSLLSAFITMTSMELQLVEINNIYSLLFVSIVSILIYMSFFYLLFKNRVKIIVEDLKFIKGS